jgi:hypothetical protein
MAENCELSGPLEIFQRDRRSVGTRDLIRRMSLGNSRWRAPRIDGELLKLGGEVSQATVGRYLPRRSLPDLPQLSAEPCDRHRRSRHVRGGDLRGW